MLVRQAINMERETIELAGASTSAIRDFTRVIADDSPRFSFFVFKRELSFATVRKLGGYSR
jgi:twinfilin-like protein